MCGFTGFVQQRAAAEGWEAIADAMAGTLVHRGPDDNGVWLDREAGVVLAHRRLAVLDLTEGHQPMVSADGRCVIAYNGEIITTPSYAASCPRIPGAGIPTRR